MSSICEYDQMSSCSHNSDMQIVDIWGCKGSDMHASYCMVCIHPRDSDLICQLKFVASCWFGLTA
jgi:hypothetical protein